MAEEENKNEETEVDAADAVTPAETPAPEAAAEEAAPEATDAPAEGDAPVEGESTAEGEDAPAPKEEKKRDIFAELLGEEDPDKVKVHKSKRARTSPMASFMSPRHSTTLPLPLPTSVETPLVGLHQVRWALKVLVRVLLTLLRLSPKTLVVRQCPTVSNRFWFA